MSGKAGLNATMNNRSKEVATRQETAEVGKLGAVLLAGPNEE